jgi:hypothetical protein
MSFPDGPLFMLSSHGPIDFENPSKYGGDAAFNQLIEKFDTECDEAIEGIIGKCVPESTESTESTVYIGYDGDGDYGSPGITYFFYKTIQKLNGVGRSLTVIPITCQMKGDNFPDFNNDDYINKLNGVIQGDNIFNTLLKYNNLLHKDDVKATNSNKLINIKYHEDYSNLNVPRQDDVNVLEVQVKVDHDKGAAKGKYGGYDKTQHDEKQLYGSTLAWKEYLTNQEEENIPNHKTGGGVFYVPVFVYGLSLCSSKDYENEDIEECIPKPKKYNNTITFDINTLVTQNKLPDVNILEASIVNQGPL